MTIEFLEAQYGLAASGLRQGQDQIAALWRQHAAGEITDAELRARSGWIASTTIERVVGPLRLVSGHMPYTEADEDAWQAEIEARAFKNLQREPGEGG